MSSQYGKLAPQNAVFTHQFLAIPTRRWYNPMHCRRGARVVDWARLEIVCTFTGTEGSNPSLSANESMGWVASVSHFRDGAVWGSS